MADSTVPPRFLRAYPPAEAASVPALYFAFRGEELLLHQDDALPDAAPAPLSAGPFYLGDRDGVPVVAGKIAADAPLPDGFKAVNLRALYDLISEDLWTLAGYAFQIIHWETDHRFCAHCGAEVANEGKTWGKKCPNCGRTAYPPVVPAVLALVHDGGDRILLASKSGWGKRYSILAGFVEPGETFEQCAIREVEEEAGVLVADTVYFGSQAWPFPHQIMVAFTCRHISGDIKIDEEELAHADWFRYDALPQLPPTLSLSRRTIDAWIASRRHANNV